MTASTYTLACAERAADFIATQMAADEVPTLDQIAHAANLSRFHIHRIYRLATGETCQQTIGRLRMAKGASALRDGSVTQAALTAGYETSQAFAKALRQATGQTATALRSDDDRLGRVIEQFSLPAQSGADLVVELIGLDPFQAIVSRTQGLYPNLNETYYALFEAAGDPSQVQAILGWPIDDIDGGAGVFDCGLLLEQTPTDLPPEIHSQTIDAAHFLRLRHTGAYDCLSAALDRGYEMLMQSDDAAFADRPCLFHYLDDPETTAEDALRTDILIPVTTRI